MNWIEAVAELEQRRVGYTIVTILSVQGSSPRNSQCKMVVDARQSYDTIGGGELELAATQYAQAMLMRNARAIANVPFNLGRDLNQCCGGRVELLFECFPACRFNIALFGAGHVGKALTMILSQVPCRICLIDTREELLAKTYRELGRPASVVTMQMRNPFDAVAQQPTAACYLIMTHRHDIDFEICEAVLDRRDISYCGLIGSKSKAAGFKSRLKKKGYSEAELGRLTSPIGIDLGLGEIGMGKSPMEVAVSVAAEVMQLFPKIATTSESVEPAGMTGRGQE